MNHGKFKLEHIFGYGPTHCGTFVHYCFFFMVMIKDTCNMVCSVKHKDPAALTTSYFYSALYVIHILEKMAPVSLLKVWANANTQN